MLSHWPRDCHLRRLLKGFSHTGQIFVAPMALALPCGAPILKDPRLD